MVSVLLMLTHEESIKAVGLRVKSPQEVNEMLMKLRRHLERLYGKRLRGIYLFGSYARGEAEAGSDLDVLIVLDRLESHSAEIRRTNPPTADLSLEYDTTISTIFVAEEDWHSRDTPLLRNVGREGVAA